MVKVECSIAGDDVTVCIEVVQIAAVAAVATGAVSVEGRRRSASLHSYERL